LSVEQLVARKAIPTRTISLLIVMTLTLILIYESSHYNVGGFD